MSDGGTLPWKVQTIDASRGPGECMAGVGAKRFDFDWHKMCWYDIVLE